MPQVDLLEHGADRVAGPALAVLHDRPHVGRVLGQVAGDLFAAVAYHDDQFRGVQFAGCGHHMVQHAPATDRVQHFRQVGFHPRARACGKNDDGGRTAFTHVGGAPRSLLPGLSGLRFPFASDTSRYVGKTCSRTRPWQDTARSGVEDGQPAVAQRHQPRSPPRPGPA